MPDVPRALGLELGGFMKEMSRFTRVVTNSVNDMRRAVEILSLGIDYKRYSFFRAITPTAFRLIDGTVQFHDLQPSEGVTPADIEYCVSSVVEASIRLAGGFPTTAEP